MDVIVYKLGGSLLELPDLSSRLGALVNQPVPLTPASRRRPPQSCGRLVVVGGGVLADAVRRWDRTHALGDRIAHDLALRSMSFNAQLVAAAFGGAQVVKSREAARETWAQGQLAVLAAAEFVEAEERAASDAELLPRSWDVTSDSVAAWVTVRWPAVALVLLKSAPLPPDCDAEIAAERGLVDPHFPHAAGGVPWVGWANLREDAAQIKPLSHRGR